MLNKVLFLLIALLISLNMFCYVRADVLQGNTLYTYSVIGYYYGMYRLDLSGLYKILFTKNSSDHRYGYLKLTYRIDFSLNIHFDRNTVSFLYIYYLKDYVIEYDNIQDSIVSIINKTLSNLVNKTFIQYSNVVDPPILLNISDWNNYTLVLNRIGDKRSLTGLSLFNDILCFEYTNYREEITRRTIHRFMSKAYYEPISLTPLYVYIQSVYIDLLNETNYLRIVLELNQDNIGYSLSKITRSQTYHIVFNNDHRGRIGIVTYSRALAKMTFWNNTLRVETNIDSPFRLIIIVSNPVKIQNSDSELSVYYLKTNSIYVTPVLFIDNIHITFDTNVSKLLVQSRDYSFVKELTFEEKQYSSISIIGFTLFVNIILLYAMYKLSRILAKIVSKSLD